MYFKKFIWMAKGENIGAVITNALPECLDGAEAKSRSCELSLGLPHEWQEPSSLSQHHCCLGSVTRGKLESRPAARSPMQA